MSAPNEINELVKAMAKAQAEMDGPRKDAKANYGKYASLASVLEAIIPPLNKNGLILLQRPCQAPEGFVGLCTTLAHSSGQSIEEVFFMPVKDPRNPQAVGSALTYARRYTAMALCGIAPEDDDGNAATKPDTKGLKDALVAAFNDAMVRLETTPPSPDVEAMKEVYLKTKASALEVEEKTKLLTWMAEEIKKAG